MKFIGLREKLGDTGNWKIEKLQRWWNGSSDGMEVIDGTSRDVFSIHRLLMSYY